LTVDYQVFFDQWSLLNPDFYLKVHSESDMENLITTHYPEFTRLYRMLYNHVEKNYLWRFLVVHRYGGIYIDLDTSPKRPLTEWLTFVSRKRDPDVNALVSVKDLNSKGEIDTFVTWGFYGLKPSHPLFYQAALNILYLYIDELNGGEMILNDKEGALADAVWKYAGVSKKSIKMPDSYSTNVVKDILILRHEFKGFVDHLGLCLNRPLVEDMRGKYHSIQKQWDAGKIHL
jgi:hypothetical protein